MQLRIKGDPALVRGRRGDVEAGRQQGSLVDGKGDPQQN